MNFGGKIARNFAYTPMIKFTGPRANLPSPSPLPPLQMDSKTTKSNQPSIIIPSFKFPPLTDEQIEMINMGGAIDPPAPKKQTKKWNIDHILSTYYSFFSQQNLIPINHHFSMKNNSKFGELSLLSTFSSSDIFYSFGCHFYTKVVSEFRDPSSSNLYPTANLKVGWLLVMYFPEPSSLFLTSPINFLKSSSFWTEEISDVSGGKAIRIRYLYSSFCWSKIMISR